MLRPPSPPLAAIPLHISRVRVEFTNGLGASFSRRHPIPVGFDFSNIPNTGSAESETALGQAVYSSEEGFQHMGAFWVMNADNKITVGQALTTTPHFWVVDIQDNRVANSALVTSPAEVCPERPPLTFIAKNFVSEDQLSNDELTTLFLEHGAVRFSIDEGCHSVGRPPTPETPRPDEEERDPSPERPIRKRVRRSRTKEAPAKKQTLKIAALAKKHERPGAEVVEGSGDDGKSVSSDDLPPDKKPKPRRRNRPLTGRQRAARVEIGPNDDAKDIRIKKLESRLRFEVGLKIKYFHLYRNSRYQLRQIEMRRAENLKHTVGKALADKAGELLRTQGTLLARMQEQIALERKYINATQADSAASMLRTLVSPVVEADAEVRQFRARWNEIGKRMCEGRPGVTRFKEFIQKYIGEMPPEEMSETRKELTEAVEHLRVDDDLHLYTFYLEWNQLANSIFHDVVTDPTEATVLDVERTHVREILLRAKIHPQWLLTTAEYMRYQHGNLVLKHAPPPPGRPDAGPPETVPRGINPFRKLGQLDFRYASEELVASHLEGQLEEFEGEGKEDMERLPKVYNMNLRYPVGANITEDALDDLAMGIFGKFAVLCRDGAAMIPSLDEPPAEPELPPNNDDDAADRMTPLDQVARMAVLSQEAAAAAAPPA